MSEITEIFPDKPIVTKPESSTLVKSLISAALFIGAFYVIFDKNITYILLLVMVLLIHESGHFLAMKYFNYTDVKMFFIPLLGALVTGEKQEISQKQKAVIILAGPVPGIFIGILLLALNDGSNQLLSTAANMFVFLNIFNLIPVSPLDGGNLIEILFFSARDVIRQIFIVLSIIALVGIAVYTESYIFLLIPFTLVLQLRHQFIIKKLKSKLEKDELEYNKPFSELSNREYWLIRKHVISTLDSFKYVNKKTFSISDQEYAIAEQIRFLADTPVIKDLSGVAKALILFLWFLCTFGAIIAFAFLAKF
jgi:stage IV sporulation protein FB